MDVFRQGFSVILVFSLLGVVLWALRRGGQVSFKGFLAKGFARTRTPGHEKAIFAVERLALTPQHTLHVVRFQGQEILVASHPQGCTVLSAKELAMSAGA